MKIGYLYIIAYNAQVLDKNYNKLRRFVFIMTYPYNAYSLLSMKQYAHNTEMKFMMKSFYRLVSRGNNQCSIFKHIIDSFLVKSFDFIVSLCCHY